MDNNNKVYKKNTPAPWTFGSVGYDQEFDMPYVVIETPSDRGVILAKVFLSEVDEHSPREFGPDARLFVAAPELLEMAKVLDQLLSASQILSMSKEGQVELQGKVAAVIAKAEGSR